MNINFEFSYIYFRIWYEIKYFLVYHENFRKNAKSDLKIV